MRFLNIIISFLKNNKNYFKFFFLLIIKIIFWLIVLLIGVFITIFTCGAIVGFFNIELDTFLSFLKKIL